MCDVTVEGASKCCLLLPEFRLAWIQYTLKWENLCCA